MKLIFADDAAVYQQQKADRVAGYLVEDGLATGYASTAGPVTVVVSREYGKAPKVYITPKLGVHSEGEWTFALLIAQSAKRTLQEMGS